jgi:hypothetical protein
MNISLDKVASIGSVYKVSLLQYIWCVQNINLPFTMSVKRLSRSSGQG